MVLTFWCETVGELEREHSKEGLGLSTQTAQTARFLGNLAIRISSTVWRQNG